MPLNEITGTNSMTQTVVSTFQDKLLWIKCKLVFNWLMIEKKLTVILPRGQFSTDKQRKILAPPVLPKIFTGSIFRLFRALICYNRGRKWIGKKLLFKKERSTVPILPMHTPCSTMTCSTSIRVPQTPAHTPEQDWLHWDHSSTVTPPCTGKPWMRLQGDELAWADFVLVLMPCWQEEDPIFKTKPSTWTLLLVAEIKHYEHRQFESQKRKWKPIAFYLEVPLWRPCPQNKLILHCAGTEKSSSVGSSPT